jgi:hypothetical protein
LQAKLRRPLVSSFVQADALSKLLIEKGIVTQQEFLAKILEERATYQAMLKPIHINADEPNGTQLN